MKLGVRNLRAVLSVLLLLGVFALGLWLRPLLWQSRATTYPGATACKSGPWGELDFIPITISAPDELLPVRALEARPLVWSWDGLSLDDLSKFFASVGVSAAQREQLLQPAGLTPKPNGLVLRPARETVLALDPGARREIYKRLAQFADNRDDFFYLPIGTLPELMRRYGVSAATTASVEQWSCGYGRYTIVFGLSCILSSIPVYEEKARFMKAVSRQPTYLLHLHVTPESDLTALNNYWGKACWSVDVRAFLDSLAAVRGGTWLDVIELLPPLPTSLLYTYPVPQNPLKGHLLVHDCHWTAFNFFRDPPDERYANPAFVMQHLKADFFPVLTDPRYGDLVLLTKPDGDVIHSAVFLADDFVFSKNGNGDLHPWIIASLPDLLEKYSFQVPPDQKLNVVYYRNKYY